MKIILNSKDMCYLTSASLLTFYLGTWETVSLIVNDDKCIAVFEVCNHVCDIFLEELNKAVEDEVLYTLKILTSPL